MKLRSNLAFCFLAFLTLTNFYTVVSQSVCSYGTFFNGSGCQDCGLSNFRLSVKIVNGTNATRNSLPSQALVSIRTSSSSNWCGGTLISRRTVMTAAHCVTGRTASNVRVYLGAYDRSKLGTNFTVASRLIVHPSYSSSTSFNDLALIILPTRVTLSSSVGVACLPQAVSTTYPSVAASSVIASGWGTLSYGGKTPNILQNVRLSVLGASNCTRVYTFRTSSQICAGELAGGKDTCQGDSGGPLYRIETIGGRQKQVVSGATSYGIGCARRGYPGVYTRVANFLPWIRENMVN